MKIGDLDLLAGCPPCQGFSAIRRLNGSRRVQDSRNDLIFDFLRLVLGLRPKAVMIENVPGLKQNVRLPKLKAELKRLGYTINVAIKDAQHFGVPQRRKRFILLAGRGDAIPFVQTSGRIRTVRQTFAKLRNRSVISDPLHNTSERRSDKVLQLIKRIPKDGGSRLELGENCQLQCHLKCDGFRDVYGRMAWAKVAPTLTSGCVNPSKGRFLHPEEHRAITLREAALLQGFPISYWFSLSRGKYAAAEMIGNAVPPPFSRMQAIAVKAFLAKVPKVGDWLP